MKRKGKSESGFYNLLIEKAFDVSDCRWKDVSDPFLEAQVRQTVQRRLSPIDDDQLGTGLKRDMWDVCGWGNHQTGTDDDHQVAQRGAIERRIQIISWQRIAEANDAGFEGPATFTFLSFVGLWIGPFTTSAAHPGKISM